MALIKCPECGADVSSLAVACPKCVFPISEHIAHQEHTEEIEQLTEKIKPCTFSCPSPRLKVCIKCTEPFGTFRSDWRTPVCNCNMPGVEVDYPEAQYTRSVQATLYVLENHVLPRNIGDTTSEEYKSFDLRIRSRYRECNQGREWDGKYPPQEVLPDPKYYGVDKMSTLPTLSPAPKPAVSNMPKCPVCQSTDLKKISGVTKAAKIYAFGLFGAEDVGKTWKCNKCGSKF